MEVAESATIFFYQEKNITIKILSAPTNLL
jgi:hypothetical protein